MRSILLATLLLIPAPLGAQAVAPGGWTAKTTVRELDVPGLPKFLVRRARGKSRSEAKCIAPAQASTGIAQLLTPAPKAKCTVERQQVANGRFEQVMLCPQKKGSPMRVERAGAYSAAGIVGTVTMSGQTPKGPMKALADQTITRTGATCKSSGS